MKKKVNAEVLVIIYTQNHWNIECVLKGTFNIPESSGASCCSKHSQMRWAFPGLVQLSFEFFQGWRF